MYEKKPKLRIICKNCGKEFTTKLESKEYCNNCLHKIWYDKHVKKEVNVFCIVCGEIIHDAKKADRKLCKRCASIRNREKTHERFNSWKKAGLCPRCGREKDKEMYFCSTCIEKRRNGSIKHVKYLNKVRDERRISGVCTRCGAVLVEDNHKMCERCREYNKIKQRESRERRSKK
jgi:DNA-directed RNA polymerase subunit RPC12/RpoP